MKYDIDDIRTVDDGIGCNDPCYFGNDKEELLARANSGVAESYLVNDVTEGIFYVPDFRTKYRDGKGRTTWEDDCYTYAIPVAKPYIRESLHTVSVRVEFNGVIGDSFFARSQEEAEKEFLEAITGKLSRIEGCTYRLTVLQDD